MDKLIAFIAGSLFSLGLIISQMANPEKVKGFLDVLGNWDPTLAFVMIGALIVTSIGFKLIKNRTSPWCAEQWSWPSATAIDRPLIIGAILFGIGWGLSGLCPGPAVVGLATMNTSSISFFIAMLVGMKIYALIPKKIL